MIVFLNSIGQNFKEFKDFIEPILYPFGLISACGVLIWKILPYRFKEYLKRQMYRLRKRGSRKNSYSSNHAMEVGDICLDDFIPLDGTTKDYNVFITHDESEAKLPDDLQKISLRLKEENENRKEHNQDPIYYEGRPLALKSIMFTRAGQHIGDDDYNEKSECRIFTQNSSFFNALITLKCLDQVLKDGLTVREKYYNSIIDKPLDIGKSTYALIHGIGINVMIVTKDRKIVLSKRNEKIVAASGGELHISVGEHLNRELADLDREKNLDIQNIALRGILQELGINDEEITTNHTSASKVRFFSVGFAPVACQYGFIGYAETSLTSEGVLRRYPLSKDGRFEATDLIFFDFSLDGFARFLLESDIIITQWAFASVIISLIQNRVSTLVDIERKFTGSYWKTRFKEKLGKF